MGSKASGTKGKTNNPNGRPKGAANKTTDLARQAIAKFVDDNSEKFQEWLDEIYKEHGAKDAFNCVKDLIEYHVPKLSRTDVNHGGNLSVSLKDHLDAIDGTSADLPHKDR